MFLTDLGDRGGETAIRSSRRAALAIRAKKFLLRRYHELFTAILNRCATYGVRPDPDVVTVDFELAVPRALTVVFRQHVQVQFCFFHLTQSTWRNIQEMGIAATYRTDNNFRHFCGMLDGLAFLPPTDVSAGIAHLRTITPALAIPLVDYFDKTYVHGNYRQGIARAALRISAQAIRTFSALIARAALRIDIIAVSPPRSPKSVKKRNHGVMCI